MPHELPATPSEPLEPSSDAELIALSKLGSAAAFGELWARHAAAGRTVARSFTSSLDPDDLVSEAFTRIYQLLLTGRGPSGAFRPYLFTTIRNTAASWGRARRETSIDTLETLEDPHSSEEASLAALDKGLTATAFRALPTRWQEVLWYSEVESMTPAQIGPLLGMSANSVAALSYRAREGLRQAWIGAHLNSENLSDDCRWSIERLGGYIRDGLGKRDTARLEQHLDACTKCTIAASEAKDVGSRLTLVLLPLAAGIGGSAAYTHWLQTGGPASELALTVGPMPVSVTASGLGSTAGGVAVGSAAGTFAATTAATTTTLVLPTASLAGGLASISVAAVISGLALAASVAALVIAPSLPAFLQPSTTEHVAAEPYAPGAPATPEVGPQRPDSEPAPQLPPQGPAPELDRPATTPPPTAAPAGPTPTPLAAPAITGLDTGGGALFPRIEGTARPGATITLSLERSASALVRAFGRATGAATGGGPSLAVPSVTADANGHWSATLSQLADGTELPAGGYRLSTSQTAADGTESPSARGGDFTLAPAPALPGLDGSTHVRDALPPLEFSGIPGFGVGYSLDGGASWSTTSLNDAGTARVALAPRPLGPVTVDARHTGSGGRVGPASTTTFTVAEQTPPPAPIFEIDTAGGRYHPVFSGTGAEPRALIRLNVGGAAAEVRADELGAWSTTLTGLAPGSHTASAAQVVGALSSPPSAGTAFTLIAPPAFPEAVDGGSYGEEAAPEPIITGVPNATLEYSFDGGAHWAIMTLDGTGGGYPPLTSDPYAIGLNTVSLRYGDGAGRVGPASVISFTLTPEVPPAIPRFTVDTNDGTYFPMVSGTGAAADVLLLVYIDDEATPAWMPRADAAGDWSTGTIGSHLAPGAHRISVEAVTSHGTSSGRSPDVGFTLLPPPGLPADFLDTPFRADRDLSLDFSGSPGKLMQHQIDGSLNRSWTVLPLDGSGQAHTTFNVNPGTVVISTRYGDGVYAGVHTRYGPTASVTIEVGAVPAPAAPAVDTGGGLYSPVISGTGFASNGPSVYTTLHIDGMGGYGNAYPDASGAWSIGFNDVAPGVHSVTATQHSAWHYSAPSAPTSFTIAEPPSLPALDGSEFTEGSEPSLEFHGVPGARFEYSRDGGASWVAGGTLDAGGVLDIGTLAFTPGAATVQARYSDGAARRGPASSTAFTVLARQAPAAPGFTVDTADGRVFPLVSGTDAAPGARIDVSVDGAAAPAGVIADSSGAWSTIVDGLTAGAHEVTVLQSVGGLDSAPGAPQSFTLAPPPALSAASITGPHRAGQPLNLEIVGIPDSAALRSWSNFPADWSSFRLDGTTGTDSVAVGVLPAGDYWFRFHYVNPSDQRVGPTGESRFTVDPLPTLPAPTVDTGGGRYRPIVSGTGALPNAVIRLNVVGTVDILLGNADSSGTWSFPVSHSLAPDTQHTVTVRQLSGSASSPASPSAVFTLVRPSVQASLNGSRHPEDALPPIQFSGIPGAGIKYSLNGDAQPSFLVLDASGQASVSLPPLSPGDFTLSMQYSGGGRDGMSHAVTFRVDPRTLAVPSFTVDTAGGLFKPLLSGTDAEPLATIQLKLNGTLLAPVAADANGDWSVTESNVQANVLYQVTASQQLGASNSPVSAAQTFQLKAPQILSPANNSMHSSWGPIGVTVQGEPGAFVAGVLHTGGPVDGKLLYLDGSGGGAMTFNESAVGGWTTGQIEVYYADPNAGGRTGVSTTISVTGN